MLRVLACISEDHDLRLVVVAALICALAAFSAFSLRQRAIESSAFGVRLRWLTAAAACTGAGVWATHFVAMLAFKPNIPIGYDLGLTSLSIVIAIAITWFGLAVALFLPRLAWLGGAVVGGAVGSMHYVGMAAMRVQAVVQWDAVYVLTSLAIGIALGAVALWTAQRKPGLNGRMLSAALLALGICGLHFTAMAAASLEPDPGIPLPERMIEPGALAIAIAAVTILIVALGLVGSIVDRHLAERAAGEAARLRDYIGELEGMKRQLETTALKTAAALQQAEAGNRAKSEFLAAMSHELRTPLNAVIGFADMLGHEPFGQLGNPRYREYVSHIRNSGAHLLQLINDVLEFSKAEAGALDLEEGEVDLGGEIASALAGMNAQAARGRLTLKADIEAGLPRLFADGRRVRQILLNLLSNAIKFTPPGGDVRVRAWSDNGRLAVMVADTGIGIAPEDIAKAFESFRQIDSRLSRRYEGAGIGLPLTKQLVERHGGTIALDSRVGEGTTATVTFPAERTIAREERAPVLNRGPVLAAA
jgi:signal transduction histidine kinase